MPNETNIFSFGESPDPVEKARAALRAVRQYQQDWQEQGVDRVHKYFDDVEGNWLENFDGIKTNVSPGQVYRPSFSDVISKLRSLGLSKAFIENVAIPSWWSNDSRCHEEAIPRLLNSLCKRLILEFNLYETSFSLSFARIPTLKHKLQKNQGNSELFDYLAMSVVNTVLGTIELSYTPVPTDALLIRNSILQDQPSVGLNNLLQYCWNLGVPVVHLDLGNYFDKRAGHTKVDGFVVIPKDRPVIVIGSSRRHSAWLLFILAHELGHIALGHLKKGVLSDESFLHGTKDQEEEEANRFATELLFGDIQLSWPKNLNKQRLLLKADRLSKEHNVDPGALVLNYGWQTGNWGCAVAALNELEPDANAPAQINAYYQGHLVSLDEESRDYLERVNVLTTSSLV